MRVRQRRRRGQYEHRDSLPGFGLQAKCESRGPAPEEMGGRILADERHRMRPMAAQLGPQMRNVGTGHRDLRIHAPLRLGDIGEADAVVHERAEISGLHVLRRQANGAQSRPEFVVGTNVGRLFARGFRPGGHAAQDQPQAAAHHVVDDRAAFRLQSISLAPRSRVK